MRKVLILSILTLLMFSLSGIEYERASFRDFIYGSTEDTAYDNWVSHITEGIQAVGYNIYAPWNRQTKGFGKFILPGQEELEKWSVVVHHFLNVDFANAESAIAEYGYPYEIVEFEDTDTNRTYYILREKLNDKYFDDNGYPNRPEMHQNGGFDYAWGLYVVDPSSDIPVIVNVVHSADDFISIPIATIAFQEWNARYLMFNAVGRELMWDDKIGPDNQYANNKSLSDPSRNSNHPFNTVYGAVCDQIRSKYGRRELSIQIHSYDHIHPGNTSIHISAMDRWGNDYYTGLPSQDISGNYNDIINKTPYVVLEANTIGSHEEVLVTDYYSVLAGKDKNAYYKYGDELLEIDNDVFLASAISNKQMLYSNNGWNIYDTFSPFFHIELRELPKVYEQTKENFKWFYGYDEETDNWDTGNYYKNAIAFYTPWIDAVTEVLPDVIKLDDEEPPSDPANFHVIVDNSNEIELGWDKSSSYDFETYEIFYGKTPPNVNQAPQRNRNNAPKLASQVTTTDLFSLSHYDQYYFILRAKDKNGNYSNPCRLFRYQPIEYSEAKLAVGIDHIEVNWKTAMQLDIDGFIVKRAKIDSDEYEIIAHWEDIPELQGSIVPNTSYSFKDYDVQVGEGYKYIVAAVEKNGWEIEVEEPLVVHFIDCYHVGIKDLETEVTDYFEFGVTSATTDGFDEGFDFAKKFVRSPSICSYQADWGPNRFLQRDIRALFDTNTNYKTWTVKVNASSYNRPFEIFLENGMADIEGGVYLYDPVTKEGCNLKESSYQYTQNVGSKEFLLFWGGDKPNIPFMPLDTSIVRGGDSLTIKWDMKGLVGFISGIKLFFEYDEGNIAINQTLKSEDSYTTWNVPDGLTAKKGHFVLLVSPMVGQEYKSYSDFAISIIPSRVSFSNEAGWHLKTNPFKAEWPNSNDLSKYFGEGARLYSYNQNEYEEADKFLSKESYWVLMPEDFTSLVSEPIYGNKLVTAILSKGWNLVGNPHALNYKVKDFGFEVTEREFLTYREAVESKVIANGTFGMRNNRIQKLDELEFGEAFWIYSNSDDIRLYFELYTDYESMESIEPEWEVTVMMRDDGMLCDEIVLGGVEEEDESKEYLYELLKPLPHPFNLFEIYLVGDEGNPKLHQKYVKDSLALGDMLFQFSFEVEPNGKPVYFSMKKTNLPEMYSVVLKTDDLFVVLSDEEEFCYVPTSDKVTGVIIITDRSVTGIEEELPLITELQSNYPNPFYVSGEVARNVGTVIPFTLAKPTKVRLDIYNIKGQRIATLLNGEYNSGKHRIIWDGMTENSDKKAASGVYFYQMSTDSGFSKIKRMVLLR